MNEIKLIIQCQKGEKEAFNKLITIYYPYVSKFLIKLTADEEIAQDLVQGYQILIQKFKKNLKTKYFMNQILIVSKCIY